MPQKPDRYVYVLWMGDDQLPFYIGVGKVGNYRHREHRRLAGKEKFNRAKTEFIAEKLAHGIEYAARVDTSGLTIDEAYIREIELIHYYGRRDLGTGFLFNANMGGAGGKDPAPSTRLKISVATTGNKRGIGNKSRLGQTHPAETLATMRGRPPHNKGKPHSPETRARMAEAASRRAPQSLETRERRAASNRGQKRSPEACAKMVEAWVLRRYQAGVPKSL